MRVLIADDDPVARATLRTALAEASYAVSDVADGAAALEALSADDPPRIAILDWEMPLLSGVEVCTSLRGRRGAPHVHVMMLTTKGGVRDRIDAFEAGADDFLAKPFQPRELLARLGRARRVLRIVEELRVERAAVRGQVARDMRVGLLGPGELHRVLERELARGDRAGAAISTLLAEVQIAAEQTPFDTEETLRQVAGAMRGSMRSYDCIGRGRRGKLVVVLPGCDGVEAASVAERQLAAVEAATRAGVRIGISSRVPHMRQDATTLLFEADLALSRARQPGSPRVCFAGDPPPG